PYRHAVGGCQRCKTPVEPRLSLQWFCRMNDPRNSLARPAIDVVVQGKIKLVPENIKKTYLNWMENLRDWCISRQLWWGHRIPVWHCADCGGLTPAKDSAVEIVHGRPQIAHPPDKCQQCGRANLTQDPDVLDTWFSSALWPFSTLGWPDDTDDLRRYYPTTLMNNGVDILFFWDARMIMTGLHFLPRPRLEDRVPFKTLYIHALVRDPHGIKMSKTRGNVVDPLEIIEEYGTDAVRFTLAIMAAPGTDIALSPDRLRSYRAFANKIWNAARFLFLNRDRAQEAGILPPDFAARLLAEGPPERRALPTGNWFDAWLNSELHRTSLEVNNALEEFRFHAAADELYHFFWGKFCDWYLELIKPVITGTGTKEEQQAAWRALLTHFEWALRLLHPFMPFLTAELWQATFDAERSLALEDFPQGDPKRIGKKAGEMLRLQEAITSIRNRRAARKLHAKSRVPAELVAQSAPGGSAPSGRLQRVQEAVDFVEENRDAIQRLTNSSELKIVLDAGADPAGPFAGFRASLSAPPQGMTDLKAEVVRLRREKQKLERRLSGMRARLADPRFLEKAPDEVVRGLERRQAEYNTQYEKISSHLSRLENQLASGHDRPEASGEAQP
ncbi:MAG: class I tRNA ligase family protein, partial [Terriglobia bacterium]